MATHLGAPGFREAPRPTVHFRLLAMAGRKLHSERAPSGQQGPRSIAVAVP